MRRAPGRKPWGLRARMEPPGLTPWGSPREIMPRMSRYAILNTIRRLDPEKDTERMVFLSSCYDFPFDTTRALEFALFRTFCVPSITTLLHRTGEFQRDAQKRYDDTDIIVSELMEWGYTSERG